MMKVTFKWIFVHQYMLQVLNQIARTNTRSYQFLFTRVCMSCIWKNLFLLVVYFRIHIDIWDTFMYCTYENITFCDSYYSIDEVISHSQLNGTIRGEIVAQQ